MKLTLVILAIVGLGMGGASDAKTAIKKPIAKVAPKRSSIARQAAKKPAQTRIAKKAGKSPVARTVQKTQTNVRKLQSVRRPANAVEGAPPRPTERAASASRAAAIASLSKATAPSAEASSSGFSGGGRPMMRGPGGTHEIGEALRVTGQSRSLSMGLLFSKDNDKIQFGSPRLHYKDKITSKEANY